MNVVTPISRPGAGPAGLSNFDALRTMPQVALDAIPAAVYVVDAEGVLVRYNSRAADLWGRSPTPGDPYQRFCGAYRLHQLDGSPLPHASTPMAETLRTGESRRDVEVEIEREDGTRVIVLVNIEPLQDEAGQLCGAINCFQDITEKKALERELRQSTAFLQAVVETTPECIKVVGADGRLIQMNDAGLDMIGCDAFDEVDGSQIFGLISPDDRETWREQHQRVIGGEKVSWEFSIVGRNGTQRHMESHAAPLTLPDGEVVQLAVTRDISRRKRDEAALRESARRHREILEALPVAIYTTDREGRIAFYNKAAVDFSGNRPTVGSDSWCVSYRLFWPDGTPLPHEECPMAISLRQNRPIHGEYEAVAEKPDGTRVPFIPYATPLYDNDGRMTGAVNMLVDISERKKAEQHQKTLMDELNHRVKNTLAIVHSLATQTAKTSASIGDFTERFNARLLALSRAHDLLARGGWQDACLAEIVNQVLQPYAQANLAIEGPEVALRPAAALSLTMVLNELATNAAKYGALSVPEGQVAVLWDRRDRDGRATVYLSWRESGGPAVQAGVRRGFGTRLIHLSITRDLEGTVEFDFNSAGIRCAIDFPCDPPVKATEPLHGT